MNIIATPLGPIAFMGWGEAAVILVVMAVYFTICWKVTQEDK